MGLDNRCVDGALAGSGFETGTDPGRGKVTPTGPLIHGLLTWVEVIRASPENEPSFVPQ